MKKLSRNEVNVITQEVRNKVNEIKLKDIKEKSKKDKDCINLILILIVVLVIFTFATGARSNQGTENFPTRDCNQSYFSPPNMWDECPRNCPDVDVIRKGINPPRYQCYKKNKV